MGAAVIVIHNDDGVLGAKKMPLEVGAGEAVRVQGAVEVRHHGGFQVESAAHLPELDALDRGGHAPEDAHLVAV